MTNQLNYSQRMAPPARGRSELYEVLGEERLRGRDVLSIADFSTDELRLILNVAAKLKRGKFDETQTQFAKGQTLALLFEKPSLRTRVTFEAGMTQLGGNAIYLEGRLGLREAINDVAHNLERWVDGIMGRVFSNATLIELADNSSVPVINGLCDLEHPCQALADFQTLFERWGALDGRKLAYVGDGNNVAHSLMLLSAKLGLQMVVASPDGYEPLPAFVAQAKADAARTGASISVVRDPREAVAGADAVYTDVWASMGQEEEAEQRRPIFEPYQVNTVLLAGAKPDALVMHDLPAHRGEEITSEVFDGPRSVVFDQAENRLHAQKAVMSLVL
jgi:ornithine carbamoyltransferase